MSHTHTHTHTHTHARYNCTTIRNALAGIDVLEPVFHKLAAMSLVEYDRVLVLDFDVTMLADVSGIMRTATPPAMVPWATFPAFGYERTLHACRTDS